MLKPPERVLHEAPAPHDWPEDWPHENGKYTAYCHECRSLFIGHKRRVICKVCAASTTANDA